MSNKTSKSTHFIAELFLSHLALCLKFKPLKSEAIHETGLSGNVVTSFFPLIIFIYIYIYLCDHMCLIVIKVVESINTAVYWVNKHN